MEVMEGFLYGMFGGALAELLGLFRLRRQSGKDFPEWLTSPFYWVVTGAMVLAGGGLVVIYVKSQLALNAWVALNIGASAPLMIGTLTEQAPKVSMGRVD